MTATEPKGVVEVGQANAEPRLQDRVDVTIVYPHLPHYRYGVFKALSEDPKLRVHFLAGQVSRDGTIEVIEQDKLGDVSYLRNFWVGPVLWQAGMVGKLLRSPSSVVVFLGDFQHVSTWVAAAALRLRRTPVLFWTIGWHRPESGIKKSVRLSYYRLATRLLLYGNYGKDLGTRMGYNPGRMAVIGNSHLSAVRTEEETGNAASVARALDRPADVILVGAVIRLNRSKRLDLLVQAVKHLRDRGDKVEILLVGSGPEAEALRRQAAELDVPLHLPGAAYDEETLRRVYERLELTVVPRAVGLTAIQSMNYGTPVITSDNMDQQMPEAEAVQPGRTGDFFRHGDVSHLAEVMREWIGLGPQDKAARSQACKEMVEAEWSAQTQAERITDNLLDVAKAARG